MKQPVTLESVATAFNHWRLSRVSLNQAVPDALREQALALLIDHKKSHIIVALKINHSALKKWLQTSDTLNPAFVSLPSPSSETQGTAATVIPHNITGLSITLHHASGTEMRINGDITPALLQSLTTSFAVSQGEKS